MNQVRIREVAIPILSPIAVHTPNTCHSMKCFSLFMKLNYKKIAGQEKQISVKFAVAIYRYLWYLAGPIELRPSTLLRASFVALRLPFGRRTRVPP
jgi:hypothetical protein